MTPILTGSVDPPPPPPLSPPPATVPPQAATRSATPATTPTLARMAPTSPRRQVGRPYEREGGAHLVSPHMIMDWGLVDPHNPGGDGVRLHAQGCGRAGRAPPSRGLPEREDACRSACSTP